MTNLHRTIIVTLVGASAAARGAPGAVDEPPTKGSGAAQPAAAQTQSEVDTPHENDETEPAEQPSSEDLTELSLEELTSVNVQKVTSVAGVSRTLQSTPAAMFVITGDDIRRAGHHNVAEALRMVPGVSVSRITSSAWAVSSRGFTSRYANKLLVLIDGRAVYTPQFGGVYWDIQNVPMDDIERIEVIRGPGATLWGANAVNGVINVITKSAKDTQGGLLSAGVGNELRGLTAFRYGAKLDEHAFARVYGMYDSWDSFSDRFGRSRPDDWEITQGGGRFDWEGKDGYSLTLQGDAYGTEQLGDQVFKVFSLAPLLSTNAIDDQVVGGGNLLLRWARKISDASGWTLQTYFDRTERDDIISLDERNTYDLTFSHYFAAGDRQSMIWGLGARHLDDDTKPTTTFVYRPTSRSDDIFSAFIQDTIELLPQRLSLMIGSKFEHNDYSGFEVQPGARISWTPSDRQTVWASVSRAVRTPTRFESDANLKVAVVPFPIPTPVRFVGNKNLDAEELVAYEVGYRVKPASRLTVDFTTFFNDYAHVIATGPSWTGPFDGMFQNSQQAEVYGAEAAATWEPTDQWKLNVGYAWTREELHGGDERAENNEPRNTASLRSSYDVRPNIQLNGALYYVDARRVTAVPSYLRLDLGVTWKIKQNVELSLWGQNLLDNHHPEFIDVFTLPSRPSEVDRGVYAMVRIRF